jgi:hypothetical protein
MIKHFLKNMGSEDDQEIMQEFMNRIIQDKRTGREAHTCFWSSLLMWRLMLVALV